MKTISILALSISLLPFIAKGQDLVVYYDFTKPKFEFAANDIKTAVQEKGYTVKFRELSNLNEKNNKKKIVIALETDSKVTGQLILQGGAKTKKVGEQAYCLRTTIKPDTSYWVIGGDDNGAMYGALQIAENIKFSGFRKIYNSENSPLIKKRGIKFNIPLDKRAPTYENDNGGTSHKVAIEHVWDITFWHEYFDEMARNRFNVLSLWNPHPFTSMLDMEEKYPGIAINDVEGYDGFQKKMRIQEKIKFWQDVMAYGRNRGFEIYYCTWNIFLWNAKGKHGLNDDPYNKTTLTYLKEATVKFLETYPDVSGLGVTAGENLGALKGKNEELIQWTWDAYGAGVLEYAKAHPSRKLEFFHRQHYGNVENIIKGFKPLQNIPNVVFDVSFKYSMAHLISTVKPDWWENGFLAEIKKNSVKTWLELRTDDFYFLHWADHQFVRDFVKALPEDALLTGTFLGADGWVPSRVFTVKDPYYSNKKSLEIQKQWLFYQQWGRLLYDPNTSSELFQNHLSYKYAEVNSERLFEAWSKASRALQIANEQVTGFAVDRKYRSRRLDFQWWPEMYTCNDYFYDIEKTQYAMPPSGSNLCNFYETAKDSCGNKISAIETADKIEQLAKEADAIISSLSSKSNTELKLNLQDLKAMVNLSLYNAYKNRAAIYLIKGNKPSARDALGSAYCYWKRYTTIMDALYYPVDTQRNWDFKKSDWHDVDDEVLKDYIDLGGTGIPNCVN
jgi:hypothetical protein